MQSCHSLVTFDLMCVYIYIYTNVNVEHKYNWKVKGRAF